MSERTAVYRLFAADGALLYVGIAKNFGKRWQQHGSAKPWWPEVQRQTVDWHPDRPAAERAETEAIRAESPRHNVIHTPRQFKGRRPKAVLALGKYVGSAEIGRMLGGVSRQRVQQLIKSDDFPAPEAELDMGKVWKREAVEAWARSHGRVIAAEDS